jgi:hypothetical protein
MEAIQVYVDKYKFSTVEDVDLYLEFDQVYLGFYINRRFLGN